MALSPEDIEGREFGLSRRGYDRDEVDEFLLVVADKIRQAEQEGADTAEDPEDDLATRLRGGPSNTDDYARVGAEVAAVLRTADEGAARRRAEAETEAGRVRAEADADATRIRDEADGYAHRLRTETEAEADRVRAEAEIEARNARTALAEATEQARLTIQEADDRAAGLAREAEESAGVRRQELLAEAERQADRAASVERDVHGRLLSVRDDLDQAVGRLEPEAAAAAAATAAEQASALDPSDTPDLGPDILLGQGPPTPAVPPPPAPSADDEQGEDTGDEAAGAPAAGTGRDEPIDLSELPYAPEDDTIPPVPPPPPPPEDEPATVGDTRAATPGDAAAPQDLPYASDEPDETSGVETEEADADEDTVVDLRDEEPPGDEDDGDPLASMVRDAVGKAVQGSTRRRNSGDS